MRKFRCLIGACALLLAAAGCSSGGSRQNEELNASNISDRAEFLDEVRESEETPLDDRYSSCEVLLYQASGAKVRIYINDEDTADHVNNLNRRGKSVMAGEDYTGRKFTEVVDSLTEHAITEGFLSDVSPGVKLEVETADPGSPESISRASDISQAAKKVVEDRMGLHGMKPEIQVSEYEQTSEDEERN